MNLKVIGSNSFGNSYILENESEALLIECGMPFHKVEAALAFNISKVAGCIVTHEHGDHAKYFNKVIKAGIDLYATAGTITALDTKSHRLKPIKLGRLFNVGGFKVLAFDINHDAAEPCGFLISHKDCGTVLFLTDTKFSPYSFEGLSHLVIEANYGEQIITDRYGKGNIPKYLKDRVMKSHMSLETCLGLIESTDLSKVINIVLIHLSDGNSDAKLFEKIVESATGKQVTAANKGDIINMKLTPF